MLGYQNLVKYFLFGIFNVLQVPRMSSQQSNDAISIICSEQTPKEGNPGPHSSTGSSETVTIVLAVCGTALLITGSVVLFLVLKRCRTSNGNRQQGSDELPALSDTSKARNRHNSFLASGHYVDMSRMRPPVQNGDEMYETVRPPTHMGGYSQRKAEGQEGVNKTRSQSRIYESMHISKDPPNKRKTVHGKEGTVHRTNEGRSKSANFFNLTETIQEV